MDTRFAENGPSIWEICEALFFANTKWLLTNLPIRKSKVTFRPTNNYCLGLGLQMEWPVHWAQGY